jgi:hypothetical protein
MTEYIKLFVSIQESPTWNEKPFGRVRAWFDLVMLASKKDETFFKRGISISVKRGQLAWSILALSKKWGWSQGRVKRFIKYLEMRDQIEEQNDQLTTIITITNYEKLVSSGEQNTEQNNEQTESKRTPGLDAQGTERFGKFWSTYPKSIKREETMAAWASINPDDALLATILKDIEGKKGGQDWKEEGGRWIPSSINYLADRRWEDSVSTTSEGAFDTSTIHSQANLLRERRGGQDV